MNLYAIIPAAIAISLLAFSFLMERRKKAWITIKQPPGLTKSDKARFLTLQASFRTLYRNGGQYRWGNIGGGAFREIERHLEYSKSHNEDPLATACKEVTSKTYDLLMKWKRYGQAGAFAKRWNLS